MKKLLAALLLSVALTACEAPADEGGGDDRAPEPPVEEVLAVSPATL